MSTKLKLTAPLAVTIGVLAFLYVEFTANFTGVSNGGFQATWLFDVSTMDTIGSCTDAMVTGNVAYTVTDATGTARVASVADEDRGKLSDPVFQAFAERAVRAVEDVRCATLPLPKQMLGRINNLTFRFRPWTMVPPHLVIAA